MRNVLLTLSCFVIFSCSSNPDSLNEINRQIEAETKKIEENSKEAKIAIQQLEFISLELEAAKLKSDISERTKSSKEISDRIQAILSKGKERQFEDSVSKLKLDSLLSKRKELINK